MNIKPLLDRVVVKMVEAEETTKSRHHSRCCCPGKPQIAEIIGSWLMAGFVDGHERKMVVTVGQKSSPEQICRHTGKG